MCGFLGYDREKNLHWHWAERKVVSSSQDGHGFVSRALPGGAARGEGAALTLLWIPEPRRNGPATELRATDISFADKIFCRSQNRGLLESAAAPRRPRIVRMPGRISRDTTNLDPHSVHVVAPRRQGRVEFSGCIPVAALSLRHQSD